MVVMCDGYSFLSWICKESMTPLAWSARVTSDCQGLAKPLGLEGRVQRVRVRVGISVPLANPYP